MRCLALAQAWQDTGGSATFACAESAPQIEARLRAENCPSENLTATPGSAEDAAATIRAARQENAAWVAIDGYHFGADYHRALREAGLRVLTIDDYGHAGVYAANIVLNQNLGAAAELYANRHAETRLLLGSRHVLLRREFTRLAGWRRETPPVARNVLVTLGGADPDNATLKVLQGLRLVNVEGLEAIVLVGSANPHRQSLEAEARTCPFRVEVQADVSNMPERMQWADVGIAAGGTTSWERAFLGLPSFVLILAENQERVAHGLAAEGIAANLGWAKDRSPEQIAEAAEKLMYDVARREQMSRHGPELVDGQGAARVVAAMSQRAFRFRPAASGDCRLVWQWANEPGVRAASFTSDAIPWERHQAWFEAKLRDPMCLFFIVEGEGNEALGQARCDLNGTTGVVSFSLDALQRGRGLGSAVLRRMAEEVFARTPVAELHAYIRPSNEASLKAFANAGYEDAGPATVLGQSARLLVRRREASCGN